VNKPIKIALCLSGEPRNSMVCFPYIMESFFYDNINYQTDIYIHTFKGFRALGLYRSKKHSIEITNEFEIYKQFCRENKFNFTELRQTPFYNTVLMYYGIHRCFNLIEGDYDYYIRCRPDLMFETRLDLDYIINHLKSNKKDIWVPHSYDIPNWETLANDQLAIGTYKAMKIYSETIIHLPELINQTKTFYPEVLLKKHLDNNNLQLDYGPSNLRLVRDKFFITHPSINNQFEY